MSIHPVTPHFVPSPVRNRYLLVVPALAALTLAAPQLEAEPVSRITAKSMATVLFTGDSQACGRNLAIDYPQLVSRRCPVRAINTGVGGSNSSALLRPMQQGTVNIRAGDNVLYGKGVSWGMGPFPGMQVTVCGHAYTIDHIDEHPGRKAELYLIEPCETGYDGRDYSVEPGWDVRVARHKPDVVCLMYINDGAMPPAKQEDWREMIRRIRDLGAVPILMSPVPIDDTNHGGNHPGSNRKYVQSAKAVRELARAENAWFIDIFNLYLHLDPPFRGLIGDGIHPDTDGSTLIVNGLLWVLEQLRLTDARPFIKGWHIQEDLQPLPELLDHGVSHFTISQPDHPNPNQQSTPGFTLDAIRQNDEYGLIETQDGDGVVVGSGILLHCGVHREAIRHPIALELGSDALLEANVWMPGRAEWAKRPAKQTRGANGRRTVRVAIPPEALSGGTFHVAVNGPADAVLDAVAVEVTGAPAPEPFDLTSVPPAAYELVSDHAREDNLAANPDFVQGEPGQPEGWTLAGRATVNRPYRRTLQDVSFPNEADLRVVHVAEPGAARPFDLLLVRGSSQGNDGAYRIRNPLDNGQLRTRKRAKAAETGMQGELVHGDGCGLVPGGSCVEVSQDGAARTLLTLLEGTSRLRVSFFYRVYDPKALGTRDVPGSEALVEMAFNLAGGHDCGGGRQWADLRCSYQWQKAELQCSVPREAGSAALTLRSAQGAVVQYTGVYVGAVR